MSNTYANYNKSELQQAITNVMVARFPNNPELLRAEYKLLQSAGKGKNKSQAKLGKNSAPKTYGLSMPQSKIWINGIYLGNVCPKADGCEATCIASTGHYGMGQSAKRNWVRVLLRFDVALFQTVLNRELAIANNTAAKRGEVHNVRLNVTSDVRWERYVDMAKFPALRFYDYTKFAPSARINSANYDLTYSVTRRWSIADIAEASAEGHRMAVVVPHAVDSTATTFAGIPAVNGDKSDERFNDPRGVAVLLYVKRPTNGTKVQAIYDGGMVRDSSGTILTLEPAK